MDRFPPSFQPVVIGSVPLHQLAVVASPRPPLVPWNCLACGKSEHQASVQISTEGREHFVEETEGEFGGLGIRISIRESILTVITPLPGTPAYREGILPNDRVVKIDGDSTQDITIEQAVKKLRGSPGSG